MGKIIVLDELTACKIAAGEVIERPASVVKEMVENSIDAGATSISIEIKAGGIKYIRISDNGKGIEPDDAIIAFDKHSTSKIKCADDLDTVNTLGFRGEALASIASVADVELISRTNDNNQSIFVRIKGGHVEETGTRGSSKGTTFTVCDLFYNTPARYKFLKKDSTEAGYIIDIVQRLALAHPEISFKLISSGISVIHTPGNGDLLSCIYSIFGKEVTNSLKQVKYTDSGITISGYTGLDPAVYSNRNRQIFFVNNRHIKSKIITSSLDEAYKTITMKNKFPFCILNISINPLNIDVNVHPAKTEVRFSDEALLFKCIYNAILNSIFLKEINEVRAGQHSFITEAIPPISKKSVESDQQSFIIEATTPISKKSVESDQQYFITEATPPISKKSAEDDQQYFITEATPPISKKSSEGDQQYFITEATPPISKKSSEGDQQYFITEATTPNFKKSEQHLPPPPQIPQVLEQTVIPEILPQISNRRLFENTRIIGQAFNTYIILQQGEELIYIDQHAAHERIMYERIKLAIEKENIPSQMLFAPITIQLAPSEYHTIKSNIEFYEKIGFIIEDFGGNSIVIRAVPSIMQDADVTAVIMSGLGLIQNAPNKNQTLLRNEEAIYTVACKAAVKANKPLEIKEIQELLNELEQISNPYSCPHGRPTAIRMSKNELEKKFKRI